MESSRLSARLCAYVDAIQEARAAGVTWRQIGDLFGAKGKTAAAAYKVAVSGKYVSKEQKPLPEPARPAPTVAKTTTVPQARPAVRSLPPGASQDSADLSDLQSKGVKIYP